MNSEQHIRDAIGVLFPGECVAEVRVVKAGKFKTCSGYFDLPEHIDEMVDAVTTFNGEYNVYWTINPCNRALLGRAANRLKMYAENTTDDPAIIHRNWLPLDFDPVRFVGISSSDDEKAQAKAKMLEVTGWLDTQGWPMPVKANSGNGFHALYRIDLPADKDANDLIARVLTALAAKFNSESVTIDTTLSNASRILKAYGTLAVKGDSIPERPHRYSKMAIPSEHVKVVSVDLLNAVASLAPAPSVAKASSTSGKWTRELVEAAMTAAQVEFRQPMDYKQGLKWQHQCINNPDHRCPDAFTMLDAQGWVSCKCSHNSCVTKSMNAKQWADAIGAKAEKLGKTFERPSYVNVEDLKTKYFDAEEV